jgi:hypothetical protein
VVLLESLPEIIEAIKGHPDLTDEAKAELVARVETARSRVNAVKIQDI